MVLELPTKVFSTKRGCALPTMIGFTILQIFSLQNGHFLSIVKVLFLENFPLYSIIITIHVHVPKCRCDQQKSWCVFIDYVKPIITVLKLHNYSQKVLTHNRPLNSVTNTWKKPKPSFSIASSTVYTWSSAVCMCVYIMYMYTYYVEKTCTYIAQDFTSSHWQLNAVYVHHQQTRARGDTRCDGL